MLTNNNQTEFELENELILTDDVLIHYDNDFDEYQLTESSCLFLLLTTQHSDYEEMNTNTEFLNH